MKQKSCLVLYFILSLCLNASCNSKPADTDTNTEIIDTETNTWDSDTDFFGWMLHDTIRSLVYVYWYQETDGNVHVEYQVDDLWRSTPSFHAKTGPQRQLIVGIPYDTEAEWKVVQETGDTLIGTSIITGKAPSDLPEGTLTVSVEDKWLPKGKYLLTSISETASGWGGQAFWTFIIDRQGRPVWAQKAPLGHWTLYSQVALNKKRFLWDEATKWSDGDEGAGSTVHYAYLDKEIKEVSTPGLHHAFVQLPDGTLAWGSKDHGGSEALVEKSPDADDETVVWTCEDDWPGVGSYCESNCLFYNESTDTYLYSFYTNSSVVEIDRKTGESLWWAGSLSGGYTFEPTERRFNWQHGVSYTSAGTLLVSTKNKYLENKDELSTMVYEYEVDHDNESLEYIWGYDSQAYAGTNGDAWRLENGNTLHIVGTAAHVVEVDPDGNVVWHVEFPSNHLMGRGEFIEDLYALVSPR